MTISDLYLALFVIGLALTMITFVTGASGHSIGHGGDLGHGGGHGHGGHGMPWLNFGTVTTFLTWFGGIGYLFTAYSGVMATLVLGLALVGGVVGAGLVVVFIAKVLAPDEIPMNPADYYMPGTLARVTVTIPADGTGEIVYTQGGTRKSVSARAADGTEIPKGTEVVILRFERGIAYARQWDHVVEARRPTP
ncbi:MAG: hypothetical protein DMD81_14295 [Candidatus Rokuibacteriota bacterium]|nr:MAG: hypothetical protein DMD81_14295 [Candidatus Rokubacteria bacterium]